MLTRAPVSEPEAASARAPGRNPGGTHGHGSCMDQAAHALSDIHGCVLRVPSESPSMSSMAEAADDSDRSPQLEKSPCRGRPRRDVSRRATTSIELQAHLLVMACGATDSACRHCADCAPAEHAQLTPGPEVHLA